MKLPCVTYRVSLSSSQCLARTIAIAAALSVLHNSANYWLYNSAGDIHFRDAKGGNYQGAIDDYTKIIGVILTQWYKFKSGDGRNILIRQ